MDNIPSDYEYKANRDKWYKDTSHQPLMLDKLILALWNANKFIPLTYDQITYVPSIERPNIAEITDLHYDPLQRVRKYKPPRKMKSEACTIWFADFEAETLPGTFHTPYMCCLSSDDGKTEKTFTGTDCAKQLLDFLSEYENPKVYFHYLGYDSSFLGKFGAKGKAIQKSQNKRFRIPIFWKGCNIELRDSLALVNAKLEKFPSIFGLKDEKEAFPYNYYTIDRLKTNIGNTDEALTFIKEELRPNFIPNIDRVPNCRLSDNTFDMYKYCWIYCLQDVRLLRDGFLKFREIIDQAFHNDVYDVISQATIAFKVFEKNILAKHPRIMAYSGKKNDYTAQAVYGARCMSAYNMARDVSGIIISDNNARSLYPSAMSTLSIPVGAPKVLE